MDTANRKVGQAAAGQPLNGPPLTGQVAVITGAGRGIGAAIARQLAQLGATAVLCGRTQSTLDATARAILDAGGKTEVIPCDVTLLHQLEYAATRVDSTFGRIDILVNNAGNFGTADFDRLTLRQWDAIFASNTRGPFLVSREALKWMRRKRPGAQRSEPIEAKIIHLGSLGGLRPWPAHAHYCSSKAALHMLTKVMAKALAPEIAVNAVAPGIIDLDEKSGRPFLRRMAKQTPMRRNGRGDEIAAAVLFFATAPQFITGQILAVDGGLGL